MDHLCFEDAFILFPSKCYTSCLDPCCLNVHTEEHLWCIHQEACCQICPVWKALILDYLIKHWTEIHVLCITYAVMRWTCVLEVLNPMVGLRPAHALHVPLSQTPSATRAELINYASEIVNGKKNGKDKEWSAYISTILIRITSMRFSFSRSEPPTFNSTLF